MGTYLTARHGEKRRRAFARRERGLVALADRQHGVLTRRQLLDAGVSVRTIRRRIETGRLVPLHREVYGIGGMRISQRGRWLAAVLACGEGALLSHRSAAALWGFARPHGDAVEVTSASGRGRPRIVVHEGGIHREERAVVSAIPVTSVARTLFDVAEALEETQLERMFEEADRCRLLEIKELEAVCDRGHGRHALRPIRRLIEVAQEPVWTRTVLEERFALFCREHRLPPARTNVTILDREADAYWPEAKLVIEVDSWSFHRHRAAFERDRARDAALQAAGYRIVRVTSRRLEREPATVAKELRRILGR